MKIVAFNGSPRKDGNTSLLIKQVFSELEKEGIEAELIQIGGRAMHGCIACMQCGKKKEDREETGKWSRQRTQPQTIICPGSICRRSGHQYKPQFHF